MSLPSATDAGQGGVPVAGAEPPLLCLSYLSYSPGSA